VLCLDQEARVFRSRGSCRSSDASPEQARGWTDSKRDPRSASRTLAVYVSESRHGTTLRPRSLAPARLRRPLRSQMKSGAHRGGLHFYGAAIAADRPHQCENTMVDQTVAGVPS
jgi:hypothetical protein